MLQPSRLWRPRPTQWLVNGVLIISCLLTVPAFAQQESLGLWTGLATDVRLTKRLTLNANAQIRFSDNVQVTRAYLGELGVSYKLNKHWEVAGYYRYTGRLKKNKETDTYYYRPYHRFYAEVSYEQKLGRRLELDYRLRYQNQFKDDNDAVVADGSYLRNKLGLSYRTGTRITPFVSADVFYRLGSSFDQVRYKAGVQVQLAKAHSVDLSLFKDVELNHSGEGSGPIIGVTYKLKLGRIGSKSKN